MCIFRSHRHVHKHLPQPPPPSDPLWGGKSITPCRRLSGLGGFSRFMIAVKIINCEFLPMQIGFPSRKFFHIFITFERSLAPLWSGKWPSFPFPLHRPLPIILIMCRYSFIVWFPLQTVTANFPDHFPRHYFLTFLQFSGNDMKNSHFPIL